MLKVASEALACLGWCACEAWDGAFAIALVLMCCVFSGVAVGAEEGNIIGTDDRLNIAECIHNGECNQLRESVWASVCFIVPERIVRRRLYSQMVVAEAALDSVSVPDYIEVAVPDSMETLQKYLTLRLTSRNSRPVCSFMRFRELPTLHLGNGTGWLIGPRQVCTAQHVVDSLGVGGSHMDEGYVALFGYVHTLPSGWDGDTIFFRFEADQYYPIVARYNLQYAPLDVAVLKLDRCATCSQVDSCWGWRQPLEWVEPGSFSGADTVETFFHAEGLPLHYSVGEVFGSRDTSGSILLKTTLDGGGGGSGGPVFARGWSATRRTDVIGIVVMGPEPTYSMSGDTCWEDGHLSEELVRQALRGRQVVTLKGLLSNPTLIKEIRADRSKSCPPVRRSPKPTGGTVQSVPLNCFECFDIPPLASEQHPYKACITVRGGVHCGYALQTYVRPGHYCLAVPEGPYRFELFDFLGVLLSNGSGDGTVCR